MDLEHLYLGLSLLMSILIIRIGMRATENIQTFKITLLLIIGLVVWHGYLYFIASTGMLKVYDFPPRLLIFLVLPAFIFTGFFIFFNKDKKWLKNIPEHWLIFYQSFRILIEVLFVFTVARGFLHPNVTIEGYNYDMVYASTALIVGFLLLKDKYAYKQLALYWNYFGLVVIGFIIFLFVTHIYFPHIYGSGNPPFPTEFGTYPYILVPGFLMPSAVFMHVLSIVQLKRLNLDQAEFLWSK